ncbi:MAG: MFS transporter, partial [Solirubrobacteraceae bacterium]
NVFEDPRERAQAIGVWGGVVGISMALGPVVGGALVDSAGWQSVFLVNVPIGLVVIALTFAYVPESRAPRARRFDPVGQLLVIVALASLTYAIIEGPEAGWLSTQTIVLGAVSLVAFASLVGYELRVPEPLLEMRFFRSAPFSGATATAVAMFMAMGGFLFLNTLYLQNVRGLSPLDAGLYTLPMAGVMMVVSPLCGRVVGRWGARWPLVGGSLAVLASALILTQLTRHTSFGSLTVAYVLFGAGLGLINPPITNTAISGMPPSQAGVAAAVASTGRQVGVTLGVAVLGSLAAGGLIAIGPGFTAATHVSWWIVVGLSCLTLVLGFVTTTSWALGTAGRVANAFRDADASRPSDRATPHDDPAQVVAG